MNWQIRFILIFGAAVVLYGFLASMLAGEGPPKVAMAFEKRVSALEEAQAQDRALWLETQEARMRGTLFQLLVSNPALGDSLLDGWSSERLTSELGWPDDVQGPVWIYAPRIPGGLGLYVTVDEAGQFGGVKVVAPGPVR